MAYKCNSEDSDFVFLVTLTEKEREIEVERCRYIGIYIFYCCFFYRGYMYVCFFVQFFSFSIFVCTQKRNINIRITIYSSDAL